MMLSREVPMSRLLLLAALTLSLPVLGGVLQ